MSFNVKKSTILNKLLYLEKYLKDYSKSELKKGDGIDKDNIDKKSLKKIASVFEESNDIDDLEKTVKSLYKKINYDSDKEVSNEELSKFSEILDEVGLSVGDVVTLFNKYDESVSKDVNSFDGNDLIDTDMDNFKKTLENYPRLKELIEDVGYDKFFDLIDEDSDGIFSSDELNQAFKLDENDGKFTFEDVENILKKNDIEYKDSSKNIDDEIEEIKKEAKKIPESSSTPHLSSSGGSLSSGGSIGGLSSSDSTGSSSSNSADTQTQGSLEDQLSQLQELRNETQQQIETVNTDMNAVYDGSDSAIAAQNEELEQAQSEYEEMMEKEAEDNPAVESIKTELKKNEQDISNQETVIQENEQMLSQTEQQIFEKQSSINNLENEKSSLEASLSEVNSTEVNDNNKDEIEAKKSELTQLISQKEAQINEQKQELSELESQKEEYNKALEEAKNQKSELEEQRTTLEDELKEVASEALGQALEKYQSARENFESAKQARIEELNSNLTSLQSDISQIDAAIQQLEAQKIQEENKVTSLGKYSEERGIALAQAAESLYGGVSHGSGYCATGVSQAIQKAFGYPTYGNGCDYGNTLSQMEDWQEVTDIYKNPEDLVNLPAGAVVSWSPYNTTSSGRIYGHVYIADGQGHGISDFKENISTYYSDRGSKYRVFVPIVDSAHAA